MKKLKKVTNTREQRYFRTTIDFVEWKKKSENLKQIDWKKSFRKQINESIKRTWRGTMRGKIYIKHHKCINRRHVHSESTGTHFGNEFKKRYLYLHLNKRCVSSFRTSGWPFSMASMTLVSLRIVIEFTFVFIKSKDRLTLS